jgi:hypothetical protein
VGGEKRLTRPGACPATDKSFVRKHTTKKMPHRGITY